MKQGMHLILASLCLTVVSSLVTTHGGHSSPHVLKKKNNKFLDSFMPTATLELKKKKTNNTNGPIAAYHAREMAVRDTVKALTRVGAKFMLSAGGALGIIRNGLLPAKDDDIDIMVTSATFQRARMAMQNMRTSNGKKPYIFWYNDAKYQGQTAPAEFVQFRAAGWGPVDVWRVDEPKPGNADILCVPHYRTIITRSMFFPPRLAPTKFGIKVPVPNGKERFAQYYYGPGWRWPSSYKPDKMRNCKAGGPQGFHHRFFKSCPRPTSIAKAWNPATGRMDVVYNPSTGRITC